jgi:hypothetical protein
MHVQHVKELPVANQNQNGGRNVALPDDSVPSWRPDDPAMSSNDGDDPQVWRSRGFDDDGRSGPHDTRRLGSYGSGRRGQDRWPRGADGGEPRPSPGSFEDRYRDLGVEDRDGLDVRDRGQRWGGYWQDRAGEIGGRDAYRGRDFEPERRGLLRHHEERMGYPVGGRGDERAGYAAGSPGRGDERMGYAAGSYSRHADERTGYRDDHGWRHGEAEPEPGWRRDERTGHTYDRELAGAAWSPHGAHADARGPHAHRGDGPHRGKGPAGYQRSDDRIRELVCESLTDDDQIDASQIDVAVQHGEVTLTGTVDDRRTKRDAEDCAASVAGVRDVHNQLRVRSAAAASNPSAAPSVGTSDTEHQAQDKKRRA